MTTNKKNEKMTYTKAFQFILDTYDLPADVREKVEAQLDTLRKKANADRKPTAKQGENATIRAAVVEFIKDNFTGDGFTCSDLIKVCPAVEGKSNQYVSAIMRQAFDAGEVSKGTVKRRTYFAPAGHYPDPEPKDEGGEE